MVDHTLGYSIAPPLHERERVVELFDASPVGIGLVRHAMGSRRRFLVTTKRLISMEQSQFGGSLLIVPKNKVRSFGVGRAWNVPAMLIGVSAHTVGWALGFFTVLGGFRAEVASPVTWVTISLLISVSLIVAGAAMVWLSLGTALVVNHAGAGGSLAMRLVGPSRKEIARFLLATKDIGIDDAPASQNRTQRTPAVTHGMEAHGPLPVQAYQHPGYRTDDPAPLGRAPQAPSATSASSGLQ